MRSIGFEVNASGRSLCSFLKGLKLRKVAYRLSQHRDDAIMVEAALPGERWEVEFLEDGSVEAEVFRSDGEIQSEHSLNHLLDRHSDAEALDKMLEVQSWSHRQVSLKQV